LGVWQNSMRRTYRAIAWFKCLVKRSFRVRVQVVAHQNDLFTLLVSTIEQPRHFDCPIHFCLRRTRRCLSPARKSLREHEDARCARSLVFVINTAGMFAVAAIGLRVSFTTAPAAHPCIRPDASDHAVWHRFPTLPHVAANSASASGGITQYCILRRGIPFFLTSDALFHN